MNGHEEATSKSEVRIELDRISKRFGGRVVLRNASGRLLAGEVHVLRGRNGSGKTTLLRIMAGELGPSGGRVRVESGTRPVAAGVGFVARRSRLYGDLSGIDNVVLSARLYGVKDPRAVTDALSGQQGGGRFWEQTVRTMSTGQAQRVALACALVHEPSILLLDEPFSGLDTESSAALLLRLKRQVERAGLVVVVTHRPVDFGTTPAREWLLRGGVLVSRAARASDVSRETQT